jgi:hypothetical protein
MAQKHAAKVFPHRSFFRAHWNARALMRGKPTVNLPRGRFGGLEML